MARREPSLLKRKDMEGLQGVDYESTVALLRNPPASAGKTRKRCKQRVNALVR